MIDETIAPAERDATEREALAELVTSEGWRLFRAHVERAYGAQAVMQFIDTAIANARHESVEHEVREITAAARKIQTLVCWPEQRLAELKGRAAKEKSGGMFANLRRA